VRRIRIRTIAIDGQNRLQILPELPDGEDLRHIYRAGNGVRWNSRVGALETGGEVASDCDTALRRIIEAARSEYGFELGITPQTEWHCVPQALRERLLQMLEGAGHQAR
jgi:hypothetical protein